MTDRDPDRLLEAVIKVAARFGPIFPMSAAKRPLTPHGRRDASRVAKVIIDWWARWPDAVPALVCGEPRGVVGLDIDVKGGVDGRLALEALAGPFHPEAPTDHTPSGGFHVLFRRPDRAVRSWTIAPGLEVKGDLGAVMLPPGPGRWWDSVLGPETPLPPMPEWMEPPERAVPAAAAPPARTQPLSRYGEAALDSAVKAIVTAPAGQQHIVLNREAFAIGGLVAGGVIPAALGLEALTWAARQMPSLDANRPWRPRELERQVRDAFLDGQAHPRTVSHG